LLINHRAVLHHRTYRRLQHQLALGIDRQPISTWESQADGAGVSPRGQLKVVFEMLLTAVVNQVDAGVDLLIFDFAIGRYIGVPLGRIVAEQVIDLSRQWVLPHGYRGGVAAQHVHAHDGGQSFRLGRRVDAGGQLGAIGINAAACQTRLGRVHDHYRVRATEEQTVARAAGEELHRGIRLTHVYFERQGECAVILLYPVLGTGRPQNWAGVSRHR
ncbi:MAG TPA: hypothetical protein VGY77_10225, partial [Gemmataceae bacterium]|nr:hypothetical protein [Gemmataceae bacterium]